MHAVPPADIIVTFLASSISTPHIGYEAQMRPKEAVRQCEVASHAEIGAPAVAYDEARRCVVVANYQHCMPSKILFHILIRNRHRAGTRYIRRLEAFENRNPDHHRHVQ